MVPPSLLPIVLHNLRATLFPKNTMGPPAPPAPSLEERPLIRRRTAESLHALLPRAIAHRFYATSDDADIISTIENELLRPLDDEYLNKHLVYSILELVLLRLLPELDESPISALLTERGVAWAETSDVDDEDSTSSFTADKSF